MGGPDSDAGGSSGEPNPGFLEFLDTYLHRWEPELRMTPASTRNHQRGTPAATNQTKTSAFQSL